MSGVVVIATRWWLAWLLVAVACLMALLGANLSPSWILAPPVSTTPALPLQPELPVGAEQPTKCTEEVQEQNTGPSSCGDDDGVRASLGLWLRCTIMKNYYHQALYCGVFATRVPDLPHAHIAAMVFIVAGTSLTAISVLAVFSATCIRRVRGTSYFRIVSTSQTVAAVVSLIGVAIFPLGWDSPRVQALCGKESSFYYPAGCTVGWAIYAVLFSCMGLLLCSALAALTARSTTTEKVADAITKGTKVICLI